MGPLVVLYMRAAGTAAVVICRVPVSVPNLNQTLWVYMERVGR